MVGAILTNETYMGVGAIMNCGAVVDNHATFEDFGHLSVNPRMAGGKVLRRGAWMHAGGALGYGARVAAGEVLVPGVGRVSKQFG